MRYQFGLRISIGSLIDLAVMCTTSGSLPFPSLSGQGTGKGSEEGGRREEGEGGSAKTRGKKS